MPNTRPQVFISYAQADRAAARTVYDVLVKSSFDVWIDFAEVPTGAAFADPLATAIDRADTFVVVWSDASLRSKYASLELGYALGRVQTTATNIVPIVVGDARVPKALQRFQPLAASPAGIGALAARIAAARPRPEISSNVVSLWDDANPVTAVARPVNTGTVKWFNEAKGYGFIAPDDGGKDIFVHASALASAGIGALAEGDRVSYQLENRSGKTQLTNLRINPLQAT